MVELLLLDRDAELAALGRQLTTIRAGEGRVFVVEGPAGIGKSSLLTAVTKQAEAQAMTTITARGSPLEQDAVWGIARQLFEPIRASNTWSELTSGAAGLAARALDPIAPEPALAGDAMHAAVHGLVWLTCNLSERRPALLVIDDVHWADAASLRWLASLARRLNELPVGVLCAVRSGEPASDPDLLAELLATAPDPAVRPRPLGISAAEAIVAEALPSADASFAHACHGVTAGNPFLLRSLIAYLIAENMTPDDVTASRLSTFGPDQIVRGLERQLSRLPPGAASLAGAVAVLGRAASLRHAARLAQLGPSTAGGLADALREAGLVNGLQALTVAHPLVASALYQSLPASARARMHTEAAALLAEDGAGPEQVALHLLQTQPQANPAVVACLRTAASGATDRGAPESAAGFLRRALCEPPPDRATSADVRLELGLALSAMWHPDAVELFTDAVTTAGSPDRRAVIALRGARALGLAGYFEDSLALCQKGLGDGVDVSRVHRSRLESELACVASMQATTHTVLRQHHKDASQMSCTPDLDAMNRAFQAMLTGQPVKSTSALLAPALANGDLHTTAMDSILPSATTVGMIMNDDLDHALTWCAGLIEVARPRGWRIALAHASWLRSMALVRAGRIRSAESDARIALEFKLGNTTPAALMWALHTFVDVLTEADRLDEAEDILAAAGQLGEPPPDALGSPLLLQSRSRLRIAQHRPEEAYADACAAGGRWQALSVSHPALASWRVEAAEALIALGEPGRVRELADEHLRLAERLGTPAPQAAGLRVLAPTVGAAERPILLERAVLLGAASPARLEHIRAMVELGAALRRVNRRADAQRHLRCALQRADEDGMGLLARRARVELLAAGARPRRPATTGPEALTPTERLVANLAQGGATNRDIAAQLYVTRRTVETHLTHAFHKLGISGRAELADTLGGPARSTA